MQLYIHSITSIDNWRGAYVSAGEKENLVVHDKNQVIKTQTGLSLEEHKFLSPARFPCLLLYSKKNTEITLTIWLKLGKKY